MLINLVIDKLFLLLWGTYIFLEIYFFHQKHVDHLSKWKIVSIAFKDIDFGPVIFGQSVFFIDLIFFKIFICS